MRQHLSPPRPVVIYVVAPEIESMRNLFLVENVREIARCLRCFVCPLPRRNYDPAVMPKRIEWTVRKTPQIPGRVIEKAVLVRVAFQIRRFEIVEAAHADERVEQVGTPEECVGGVKRAEARSCRRDSFARV